MKKIFSYSMASFLILAMVSLNSCKKDEEVKELKGYITGITFTDWLDEDNNGDEWDNQLQGYDPDVYFVIEDASGNVLYNIGSENRKENVDSSFGWTLNNLNINNDTKIYVRLYDYDDLSEDDDMGACGGFNLKSYKGHSSFLINCDNMEYTLNVNWTRDY